MELSSIVIMTGRYPRRNSRTFWTNSFVDDAETELRAVSLGRRPDVVFDLKPLSQSPGPCQIRPLAWYRPFPANIPFSSTYEADSKTFIPPRVPKPLIVDPEQRDSSESIDLNEIGRKLNVHLEFGWTAGMICKFQ